MLFAELFAELFDQNQCVWSRRENGREQSGFEMNVTDDLPVVIDLQSDELLLKTAADHCRMKTNQVNDIMEF